MDAMKTRIEALRGIPLFTALEEKDLREIAGLLIDRRIPKDAIVFEEGTLGDYMYVIQEGQVKVAKMDIDGNQGTPGQYGIRAIPTVLAFKDGQVVGQLQGIKSKADFEALIKQLIS